MSSVATTSVSVALLVVHTATGDYTEAGVGESVTQHSTIISSRSATAAKVGEFSIHINARAPSASELNEHEVHAATAAERFDLILLLFWDFVVTVSRRAALAPLAVFRSRGGAGADYCTSLSVLVYFLARVHGWMILFQMVAMMEGRVQSSVPLQRVHVFFKASRDHSIRFHPYLCEGQGTVCAATERST